MTHAYRLLIAVIFTAIICACAGEQSSGEVRDWNSLTITLTRSVCFGRCPDYTVEIHGDGRVVYEGRRFVAVTGRQEARIENHTLRALFVYVEKADFFSLKSEYRAPATDLPTYEVTITLDGRSKTVVDYGGDLIGMPQTMRDLEEAIDDYADTDRWLRGPNAPPIP